MNHNMPPVQITDAVRKYSNYAKRNDLAAVAKHLHSEGEEQKYTALLLMKMLENEDPDVQSLLGDCYYQGTGVHKNLDKAVSQFQSAASRGSTRADYDLAWLYYDQQKYIEAIEFFTRCEKNIRFYSDYQCAKIYHCLGYSYSRLSKPEYHKAIEYLMIAGDRYGNELSYRHLATIYSESTQYCDPGKSIVFFEKAAQNGDLFAAHKVAEAYIDGIEGCIEKDLCKAEQVLYPYKESGDWEILTDLAIVYIQQKRWTQAIEVLEKAWVIRQEPFAASRLGYLYYREDKFVQAEKMLKYADEHGKCTYSDFLGRMYLKGDLGKTDKHLAALYYGRAFEERKTLNNIFLYLEFVDLLYELGLYEQAFTVAEAGAKEHNDIAFYFYKGCLAIRDLVSTSFSKVDAVACLNQCIKLDYHVRECYSILGNFYFKAGSYHLAVANLSAAFSAGDTEAAVTLGRLFEQGGGSVAPDNEKALTWYTKAANAGNARGKAEASCFEWVRKGLFGHNAVLVRIRETS